jgi:hypothetical protein
VSPEPASLALAKGALEAAGAGLNLWRQLAGNPASALPGAPQVLPRALGSADEIVRASADLLALARPLDDEVRGLTLLVRLGGAKIPGHEQELQQSMVRGLRSKEAVRAISSKGPELLEQLWYAKDSAIPPLDPEAKRRLQSAIYWHGILIQQAQQLSPSPDVNEAEVSTEDWARLLLLGQVLSYARISHEQLQHAVVPNILDLAGAERGRRASQLRRKDERNDQYRRKLQAYILNGLADVMEDALGHGSARQRLLRRLRRKLRALRTFY